MRNRYPSFLRRGGDDHSSAPSPVKRQIPHFSKEKINPTNHKENTPTNPFSLPLLKFNRTAAKNMSEIKVWVGEIKENKKRLGTTMARFQA